ncbi:MAG TPA: superoxide dismutase, partial [Tepidisphaeraceae bacterium]
MPEKISRRDMVIRTVPALAMAGALSFAAPLLGADVPVAMSAVGEGKAFKDGEYVLPPLPYAYDALEPHIDAETMRLHHDKHHQAYVTNLNKTLKELAQLDSGKAPLPAAQLSGLQEDLSFNAGGHLLHTLFWKIMGPGAGGEPQGELADALARDFGSVEAFRTRFAAVAAGVKGSGWAVLGYEPVGQRLLIVQVKQHDLQLVPWMEPILAVDVWEHAYYLKYKNARGEYVKAWWNVVNWPA